MSETSITSIDTQENSAPSREEELLAILNGGGILDPSQTRELVDETQKRLNERRAERELQVKLLNGAKEPGQYKQLRASGALDTIDPFEALRSERRIIDENYKQFLKRQEQRRKKRS